MRIFFHAFTSVSILALMGCAEPQTISPVSTAPVTPALIEPASSSNSFVETGRCREVLIVADNEEAVITELRRVDAAYGRGNYHYEIYQNLDGEYLGVDVLQRGPVPNWQTKVRRQIRYRSQGKRGYYDASAYCSTGEEISRFTGTTFDGNVPRSTNGGLIGAALTGTVRAINSTNSPSPSSQPTSSGSAYRAITLDGSSFSGICNDGRSAFSGSFFDGLYTVAASGRNTNLNASRDTAIRTACGG